MYDTAVSRQNELAVTPGFKDKTECITICMTRSSFIYIETLLVNNQQQYHEKERNTTNKWLSEYTAYPGNKGFKLHRQSTGDCVRLELSNIFNRLHHNFLFWTAVSKGEYTYGWYSARPQEITRMWFISIFEFINHVRVQTALDREHDWYISFTLSRCCTLSPQFT